MIDVPNTVDIKIQKAKTTKRNAIIKCSTIQQIFVIFYEFFDDSLDIFSGQTNIQKRGRHTSIRILIIN